MADPTKEQLKNEIQTDPASMGYAGNNSEEIAGLLNKPDGTKHGTVNVETVTKATAQKAVIATEYTALTSERRDLWLAILQIDDLPVEEQSIRDQVQEVWAAGTTTRNRLVALLSRPASRAEALWGRGVMISKQQVNQALQG